MMQTAQIEEGALYAFLVLDRALDVYGTKIVSVRRKGSAADVRMLVTDCPYFVEALDLLKQIEPDQALVNVLRAHLRDRAVLGGGAG